MTANGVAVPELETLATQEVSAHDPTDTDFEREPVSEAQQKSNASFATVFAGRHTAAPELVIGPQFVKGGATATSMFVFLILGNLLAVLSWRFICAPLATGRRYTTYYQVERICGRMMLFVYNIIVGLTLAVIAGGMFMIAGTAMGAGLNVDAPPGDAIVVQNFYLIIIILLTGAFTTVVAMFGYDVVTIVSYWLTPPMFIIIGFIVIRSMMEVGITGLGNFWEISSSKVFTGIPEEGVGLVITPLSVILMAWFQDSFCHLGMVDLTLFRYAKTANVGWMSAWGMFPGHYFLWIGAGFIYKAENLRTGETGILPGPTAYIFAGWFGLFAILFAGWSTANPFLYASGLAFKSAIEALGLKSPKIMWVTAVVGTIATIAGIFPIIVNQFLSFIGLAGAIIIPVGAIMLADYWVLPRTGLKSEYSVNCSPDCSTINIPAALAWLVSGAVSAPLILLNLLPYYYVPFIAYPSAFGIYIGLSHAMHSGKEPNAQGTELSS